MTDAAAVPAEDWRRTSPLSFVVTAVMSLRQAGLGVLAGIFGTGLWQEGWRYVVPPLLIMLGLSAFFSWLAWRHFRYRLSDSDIRVERGLLSRTARSVPYERIQDVALEQSLIPRLFGMTEVKFETGAGGKDEVRIRYVTPAEAEALRETVRARKSGVALPSGETAPAEESAHSLFAMNLRRLATFGLFEFSLVVFAVLGGAAQQFDFLLPFDLWNYRAWVDLVAGPGHRLQELGMMAQAIGAAFALLVLGLLGLLTGLGRTVLRDYGFRLEDTAKGLRRRRGLLNRSDTVMPVHRVQALKLTTGVFRRLWGWHGLSVVSLATDAKSGNHTIVPFAQMDEIGPVVDATGFALPGTHEAWHRSSAKHRVDQALLSAIPLGLAAAFVAFTGPRLGVPPATLALGIAGMAAAALLVLLRENFRWKHDRHALDARHLFSRHGWLAPRLDIASRVKLQSVEITQGPLARRRGYATLHLGVAGGSLAMAGVPLAEARAIRAAVLDSISGVDFSRLNAA